MDKKCLDCKTVVNNPSNHAICPVCGSFRVSGQARVLWTSKNERWTIERLRSGHIITADNHTAWNDNPVRIAGRVLWDHPGRVPKYVKEATGRFV